MLPASQLVAKCLENNAAAQKQLYDAFAPQMMGICYRYTRSMEEASDVLQEGFVRVFRNLRQWNGEGELGAWIRRIMVNTVLNWIRDHRKIKWVEEEHIPEHDPTQPVSTPLDSLQARQLADLIRQLPAGYQTVFNLHAAEGYTHVEIAQMLGISEGTSRSQYLRARRMLAELINTHHQENKISYAGRK
jgi:RNA polymerase sigma-70 factor (ECF subfamily)